MVLGKRAILKTRKVNNRLPRLVFRAQNGIRKISRAARSVQPGPVVLWIPAWSTAGRFRPALEKRHGAQMVVVYKTPSDVDAFDRHYFGVHVALAKKLPGLRKYEVSAGPITTLGSAADTHFVAVLHFDSLAAIRSAFASPEGQACAADRRKLATDEGIQTFLFDSKEV